MFKIAFKEVMRAYEADRDRAAALLESRKRTAYEKLPRVRAIDERLSHVGLALVKLALADGAAPPVQAADAPSNQKVLTGTLDQAVASPSEHPHKTEVTPAAALAQETAELRAERARLLKSASFPDDFFSSVYRCPQCADTGYIDRPDGAPERCACLKQRLMEAYYGLSNVRNALAVENFDTFDLRYYSETLNKDEGLSPHANMQTIYRTAMQFVRQFGSEFQNLLLYGDTGLGKTFLCNCIARDLLDRGHTVLYLTAPRLFRVVEDYRFNRQQPDEPVETHEMIDAVTEADLLIIDDLGAEFSTVVTSSALFDILNERLLAHMPCVISTNLSQAGLAAQYSERILSRFHGHYKMIKFFGDDIRIKKKYGSHFIHNPV